MKKRPLPLSKVYTLLGSGPVIMVTTSRNGRANVMTAAWHTMIDFAPPIVGVVIGEGSLTFDMLRKTHECVINVPTVDCAEQAVCCGSTTGRKTDKFEKYRLTPVKASRVSAPLIKECYAAFECRVKDQSLAKKYNLFILEVLKAWVDPSVKHPETIHHLGKDRFMVAGRTISVKPETQ
jgi:flavin reductase (DIM6/NTAB) family NADH-FMN oxidoreductase RutF